MDKATLIKNADQISRVSKLAAESYFNNRDLMTSKVNSMLLNRTDIKELIGNDNIELMKNNHANHAKFMASVLKNYNAEVFVSTILWVFNSYQNRGFFTKYWYAQLNTWLTVIKSSLSPEYYNEIFPYYQWMLLNIPTFAQIADEE